MSTEAGGKSRLASLPELETRRLLLRRMTVGDARDVFEYASDPEVARYVMWDAHRSIGDSRSFLNRMIEGYGSGELFSWGMVHKESGRLIGTCGYDRSWVPEHGRAELGYALSSEYWGQGLMTEAVRAVIGFGFEKMKLNKIVARCFAENLASEKVMQKSGMSYEGTQREHVFVRGRYRDLKVYSILRGEYEAS